jgi:hypothetical protein
VDVDPLITAPRMHLIFFVHRKFKVDLSTITEVFIDATFGTNSLGAHLFCILGLENGCSLPLAYMLLEAKPKEKTNDTNPEVTRAIMNFFIVEKSKGLIPLFIHVDKCWAEINAARVISQCLATCSFPSVVF